MQKVGLTSNSRALSAAIMSFDLLLAGRQNEFAFTMDTLPRTHSYINKTLDNKKNLNIAEEKFSIGKS